jgi:hypothetical protein
MIVRNLVAPDGPSYAMQLDADWATEATLDDNTALCWDSSLFGNMARFLNHRFVIQRCYALIYLLKHVYSGLRGGSSL